MNSGFSMITANPISRIITSMQDIVARPFAKSCMTNGQRIAIFLANLFIFSLASLIFFLNYGDHILFTGDLYFRFINMVQQVEKTPFLTLTMNPLIYGQVDWGFNARLMPAFLIGSMFSDKYLTSIVYFITSIELFLAVFVTAWLFRLSTLAAATSAWVCTIGTMPYCWPLFTWIELSIISPGMFSISSYFCLFVGLFFALGKTNDRVNSIIVALLIAMAFYIILAFTHFAGLIFYMLAWACAGAFLHFENRKEVAWKIASGIIVSLTMIASNVLTYLRGYIAYRWFDMAEYGESFDIEIFLPMITNLPTHFADLFRNIPTLYTGGNYYTSIFHVGRSAVPAIVSLQFSVVALAATVFVSLLYVNRRRCNIFEVSTIFLVTLAGYMTWRWSYLEAIISPLWAIMFTIGVFALCQIGSALIGLVLSATHWLRDPVMRSSDSTRLALRRKFGRLRIAPQTRSVLREAAAQIKRISRKLEPRLSWMLGMRNAGDGRWKLDLDRIILLAVLGCGGLMALLHISASDNQPPAFRYGAAPKDQVFGILAQEIGLRKWARFRGRLASMARALPDRLPDGREYVYEAQQAVDHYVAFAGGKSANYRHSAYVRDIPILFDINRFLSPGSVAIMNYFLTEESHFKQEQFFYPSKFDEKWLRFFGARYAITNELLDKDLSPIATSEVGKYRFYLYEIEDPSIGNYTPVRTIVSKSAGEMIEIMSRPDFNPRNTAIVEQPIPADLVPADTTELLIDRGTLVFSGASSGLSLAVLPFEYSHCLRMHLSENSTTGKPRLIRVNSHQMGILFNKRVSVRIIFQFSPFDNADCRLKDIEDWQTLGVRDLATFRGVYIKGGRRSEE